MRTPISYRRTPPLATTTRQARWLQQKQHAAPPGVPLTDEILEKWRKCQWLEEAYYWHVLWLLNMGVPVSEVSLIVGIGRVGIRNIRIRYNEEGPEKVFVQTRPKPRQQLTSALPTRFSYTCSASTASPPS
jgi:hypothetical protein